MGRKQLKAATLIDGLRTCSEKDQDGWSEAGDTLFKREVSMVVLKDILGIKPGAKSPVTPLDQSVPLGNEMLESDPEEDSVFSYSSPSSSSSPSSPEGWFAYENQHSSPSPFPTSIAVCRSWRAAK